jgi:hypothetical protein
VLYLDDLTVFLLFVISWSWKVVYIPHNELEAALSITQSPAILATLSIPD